MTTTPLIFLLRILVFFFLIFLGFYFSTRSRGLRKVVSIIYGCVLVWYTFLCRVRITVDVSAADYGHAATSLSTGAKILQLLKAIFGMDASGHLASVYWQAFILNCLLFVPLGYLLLLHFLCGDKTFFLAMNSNPVKGDVVTGEQRSDGVTDQKRIAQKDRIKRYCWTAFLICIATSIIIELLQGLTGLGTTDINDVIANSIGGGVGVGITLVWVRHSRHA